MNISDLKYHDGTKENLETAFSEPRLSMKNLPAVCCMR